jgi:hypothetical protein
MEFVRMLYEWLFKANEELFDGAEVASVCIGNVDGEPIRFSEVLFPLAHPRMHSCYRWHRQW